MKTTFLIGYMGSGKTTLGRAVAARTGIRFIDLDNYIEEREGCSIKEIFASRGEDAFRAIERDALQEVSRMADTLVACGGEHSVFRRQYGSAQPLRTDGVSRRTPRESAVTAQGGRAKRPLIAGLNDKELDEFIVRQMEWRRPHYSRAALRFDSSRLESAEEVAESVENF